MPPPSDDLEEDLDCAVHMVLEKSSATDKGLQKVKKNTETDHSLQRLQGFIRTGWPDSRADLPEDIRAYWNFREELSDAGGIILKGEQIVIPANMRKDTLSRIHALWSHGSCQMLTASKRCCILARHV